MRPIAGPALDTNQSEQQEHPVDGTIPATIATLRTMKMIKQAMATNYRHDTAVMDDPSSAIPSLLTLPALFKAQQKEIAQLKIACEDMSSQIKELKTRPSSTSSVCERTEKSVLSNEVKDMVAAMSTYTEELRSANKQIQRIDADVNSLKEWKDTQSSATTDDRVKNLVLEEVIQKMDDAKETIRAELRNTEMQLTDRMAEHNHDGMYSRTGILEQHLQNLEAQVEKDVNQLRSLHDKDMINLRQLLDDVNSVASKAVQFDQLPNPSIGDIAPKYDQMLENVGRLDNRISSLGQTIAEIKQIHASHTTLEIFTERLSVLENQISSLKGTPNGPQKEQSQIEIDQIKKAIQEMDAALQQVEHRVHDHSNSINTLQESMPSLFRDNFDPFKNSVEQKIGIISGKLESNMKEIVSLNEHVTEIWAQSPKGTSTDLQKGQFDSVVECTKALTEDMSKLQSSLEKEVAARVHDIREVKERLGKKGDIVSVDQQMDVFRASLKGLHDQYNNITTDEIFQRMNYWFVQMYPSDTSALLQRLSSIQQDVAYLKSRTNQTSWIESHSAPLSMLLTDAPRLLALTNELQRMSQNWARVDEVLDDAKAATAAMTKVEEARSKVDALAGRVESMQGLQLDQKKIIDHITASLPSFARLRVVSAIEKEVESLRAHVNVSSTEQSKERFEMGQETKTLLAIEQKKWAKVEQELRNMVNDTMNRLRENKSESENEHEKLWNVTKELGKEAQKAGVKEREKWAKMDPQLGNLFNDLKQIKAKLDSTMEKTSALASALNDDQTVSRNLRLDFYKVKDTLIEPNKEFLEWCGVVPLVLTQIQKVVEDMNQNLPVALDFEWVHDLNASAPEEIEADTSDILGMSE